MDRVPVAGLPPVTPVAGVMTRVVRLPTITVTGVLTELPLAVAVTVAVVCVATGVPVNRKVAVVAPARTGTVAGTVPPTADRLAVKLPVGAALEIVRVMVEVLPPRMLVGFAESETSVGALTVKVPVAVPLRVPVIVTGVSTGTADVVTENVAVVAPAATTT